MAKFEMRLPDDVLKDAEFIYDNAEAIFGEMTRAGAERAAAKVRGSVPVEQMAGHVRLSVTYKTPSDNGINTKVYFSGYIPFGSLSTKNRHTFTRAGRAGGKSYTTREGVPAAFLAQIYEYGRSNRPFPKRPFFRAAFRGLEGVMLAAQRSASGGLLE